MSQTSWFHQIHSSQNLVTTAGSGQETYLLLLLSSPTFNVLWAQKTQVPGDPQEVIQARQENSQDSNEPPTGPVQVSTRSNLQRRIYSKQIEWRKARQPNPYGISCRVTRSGTAFCQGTKSRQVHVALSTTRSPWSRFESGRYFYRHVCKEVQDSSNFWHAMNSMRRGGPKRGRSHK